ncbi:hypothetical protein PHYPSEUDO_003122 [Phytophthora pseudosyringae]|uniref:Uncharacterized protein n=1 Tax=Phytophthora pseudosyringae TaxID=221518 RepID=A0A8T1WEU7_9STRA|nr:hypothetical protein PHYPSEUDO_003122 [Phytophthora pseudosyringae]
MRVLQVTGLVLLWVWTGVQAETCADQVSSGDKGVGISGEYAPTCPSAGGVGCFGEDGCRFCKIFNTTQSAHLIACATTSSASVTPTVTPAVAPTGTPSPVSASTPNSDDDCTDALTVA